VNSRIRNSFSILIAARVLAAPASGVAQAPTSTVCSLIDTMEVRRVTGKKNGLKWAPRPDDPAELPKGTTGCFYVGVDFNLLTPASRETFERTRSFLTSGGATTQPVSGVGESAYYWWSPKPGDSRPVGIVFRAGTSQVLIMIMTSSDSVEIQKPQLLTLAKSVVPKLR
jgi:hypothetical protein